MTEHAPHAILIPLTYHQEPDMFRDVFMIIIIHPLKKMSNKQDSKTTIKK